MTREESGIQMLPPGCAGSGTGRNGLGRTRALTAEFAGDWSDSRCGLNPLPTSSIATTTGCFSVGDTVGLEQSVLSTGGGGSAVHDVSTVVVTASRSAATAVPRLRPHSPRPLASRPPAPTAPPFLRDTGRLRKPTSECTFGRLSTEGTFARLCMTWSDVPTTGPPCHGPWSANAHGHGRWPTGAPCARARPRG